MSAPLKGSRLSGRREGKEGVGLEDDGFDSHGEIGEQERGLALAFDGFGSQPDVGEQERGLALASDLGGLSLRRDIEGGGFAVPGGVGGVAPGGQAWRLRSFFTLVAGTTVGGGILKGDLVGIGKREVVVMVGGWEVYYGPVGFGEICNGVRSIGEGGMSKFCVELVVVGVAMSCLGSWMWMMDGVRMFGWCSMWKKRKKTRLRKEEECVILKVKRTGVTQKKRIADDMEISQSVEDVGADGFGHQHPA